MVLSISWVYFVMTYIVWKSDFPYFYCFLFFIWLSDICPRKADNACETKEVGMNLVFPCWLLLSGPCPHRSVPVEMDESMTSMPQRSVPVEVDESMTSFNLAWPPGCEQVSGHAQTRPRDPDKEPPSQTHANGQRGSPEIQYQHNPRAAQAALQTHPGEINRPHPPSVWPGGLREVQLNGWDLNIRGHHRGFAGPLKWPQYCSMEDTDCLEMPLPLMSDINFSYYGVYHQPLFPYSCLV